MRARFRLIITEHLLANTEFAIVKITLAIEQIHHLIQANLQ
jgi:hypothetical protein